MISLAGILGFLQSVGGFVFIFGIVVLVHELGHFLAAKMTGVYAPRFSIGFGPGPKKRWGETQYGIGLIPLGGYVRMASREDEATAFLEGGSETEKDLNNQAAATPPKGWDPEAMIPFGPKPVPEDRWFESKSLPQRLFIMIAGVSMNALLTVFVLFGIILNNGRTVIPTRVVGAIRELPVTESLRLQLQPGDTIKSIQNTPVANWNEILVQLATAPGETLSIVTNRGTARVAAGPAGGRTRDSVALAVMPYGPPVIRTVVPGDPAAIGGLRARDSVVAIGDRAVRSYAELREIVRVSADHDLRFTVIRDGAPTEVVVRPVLGAVQDPMTGAQGKAGRIGVEGVTDELLHEDVGVLTAFTLAVKETGNMARQIVNTLKGLIKQEVSFKELGGPIAIARESGRAAGQGMEALLFLLALLSINLAILNLLPIPVLDGGQIVLLLAESVKGSPFSPKARQAILTAGVALVLLLMLAVSYNDVLRLFRS